MSRAKKKCWVIEFKASADDYWRPIVNLGGALFAFNKEKKAKSEMDRLLASGHLEMLAPHALRVVRYRR